MFAREPRFQPGEPGFASEALPPCEDGQLGLVGWVGTQRVATARAAIAGSRLSPRIRVL